MATKQDPLKRLYDVVSSPELGLYSKSYKEFKEQYSTEAAVEKMYNIITSPELQLYSKDLNSFKSQYFPDLGKQTEVSGQGSAGTSRTSGQQSSSSAEPSSGTQPTPEFEASNARYAAEADKRLAAQGQRRQEEGRQNNFPTNLGLRVPSEYSGGYGDIFKPLKFGETPDWKGAQSRRLAQHVAAWQAANPDMEYVPVRLLEEINHGEIKQAVPQSRGRNMVRRGAHIYNGLLHGIGSLANYVIDTGLSVQAYTEPGVGGVVANLTLSNYRANIAPNVRNALVDVIGVEMSDAERDRWNSEIVTGGLAGLAGTVPALVGSKFRMARMFMMGADAALNSIEEADTEGKVSNLSKTVYSTVVGLAVAALEKVGFDRIFKSGPSPLAIYVAQKTISDAAKSGGGKVTGDALGRFLNANLAEVSNRYVRGGAAAVEGMITEFATGASQEMATIGSEGMFNLLSGEDIFDTYEDSWDGLMDYIGRVGEAGMMEAVGGGALGGTYGIVSASSRKKIYKKIQEVESLRRDLDNPNLSDAEADAVLRTLLDAMTDLRNDLRMSLREFDNLVEDAKQRIQGINDQILSAQDVIDSPNTSEEAKEAAEARIAELSAEAEGIASDPQNQQEASVPERSPERQAEVDAAIAAFQEANPGIEVDYFEDLPESVVTTFERVEAGLPTDPTAIDEASAWMYKKYKELSDLKNDPNRRLTIEQIEGIQEQLGEDITLLENYKLEQYGERTESTQVQPETAVDTVADQAVEETSEERGTEAVGQRTSLRERRSNVVKKEDYINLNEGQSVRVVDAPGAESSEATVVSVTTDGEATVVTLDDGRVIRSDQDLGRGTGIFVTTQETSTVESSDTSTESEPVVTQEPVSDEQSAESELLSIPDNETRSFTVSSLSDIPEPFRDRAKRTPTRGRTEVRKSFMGIPYGKPIASKEITNYTYEATGAEIKDYYSSLQPTEGTSGGEQALSPSFLEDMRTDEGRARRKEQALAEFRAALRGNANVGINGEALAKAVEYAAISLLDGSIKTARALQTALGLNEADAKKVFDRAKAILQGSQQGGLSQNNAPSTQDFFTAVVEGTDPRFIPIKPYETEGTYSPEQARVAEAMEPKFGNFDTHIATSIPQYRETQVKKAAGIIAVLEGREDAKVFDIGGSEGNMVKTVTELTGVETYNLEPNEAMASSHEATPVEGSTVIREAFYEGFDGHKAHVPTEKYDVVNESMVFQFITPERKQFIDHVADNYLKEDGIFISEEKLKTNRDLYIENEAQKDREHKSKYYTPEQLKLKSDQVLMGMDENQADVRDYIEALKDRFDYVGIYWNSGNFYGVAASNSKQTFDTFMASVGDTQTQYTKVTLGEVTDPSTIPSSSQSTQSTESTTEVEDITPTRVSELLESIDGRYSPAIKTLIEAGYILHGTQDAGNLQVTKDKFSTGRRATYGKGFYMTDGITKASDYGTNMIAVPKSAFNLLNTKSVDKTAFNSQLREIADSGREISRLEQRLDEVRNNRDYDAISQEIERLKSEQVSQDVRDTASEILRISESNPNASIDDIRKIFESSSRSDRGAQDKWNGLLEALGYDGVVNGYEYVIINESKLNDEISKIREASSPSDSFWNAIKTNEGRKARKEQALKDFKKSLGSSTNMGLNGNAFAKALEYAIISIVDGSVKSARALSKALGVTVEQAQVIYDRAVELTDSYRGSIVTPPKRSTQAQVRESTRGGVQGRVTQTERQALAGQIRSFARGVIDGQRQASEASKVLNDVMAEMRSRGMLDNLTPAQVQALTKAINSATTPAKVQAAVDRMVEILNPKQPVARRIREATEGGIKGKVDLTNRQALREQIKILNRGIRDGKKQIVEARKAITDFINEMKDQGLFKGKVRGNIIKPLLDRVNRANTPAALSEALAYAQKASEIIDYDQKRAKAEKNKKEVRRKSKMRGMPQDLKAVMIDISNINLTYVDNIEQFNDMTDRLLAAVNGTDIDGIWTEDFVKLKKSVDEKIEKAREKRLRDELVNAGMDQDFVDGLNTLNQLMKALATLPEGSKARSSESKRSIRERALKQTLAIIEEMDRTGLTDKQNAIIDALLGLDVSKIDKDMLPSVVIAAKNIAVNGSFLGTGPIEVEYKLQQRTGNTKDAANIKKTVASPRKWLARLRDKMGTVSTQIDSVLKNRDVVGSFMRMTGFGDYLAKYNNFVDRYNEEVRDKIAEVQRKYRKDLQDQSQRMLLGAFADLNNSKKSWDDSKRAEEFEARKEAIKKSYDEMVEFAELTPRGWGKDSKEYRELYKKLVDQLDSFNSVEDIWNSLNRGHQELYKVAREFYDRILLETKQNAEIDNNTIFETEWQGTYFPRSYMPLDTKVRRQKEINGTQASILDQIAEGNTFNPNSTEVRGEEVSGAKRARTLTGSQLPPGTYIDLDFMANFLRESKKMLYDVETQAERRYVARAMHSTELLEIFGDKDALEIFRNAVIQKMQRDLISTTSRGMKSTIRNISDEIYGLNVNLALGGVAQAAKQAVPQLVDTAFRLGKNQVFLYAGMYMYANGEAFGHLMKGSNVRFRNLRNVEVRDNLLSQKEVSYVQRFVHSRLGKLGEKGKEIRDFVTMGPLTLGDDFAAKSSWYAHYLDYLDRNNLLKYTPDGMMDLAEVNTDAVAYADLQVNLSNNESDPAMKAKLFSGTAGSVVRTVFPFISFPLNSKMELIRNLERVVDGDAQTAEQKKALGRNIVANISNILIYGAIGEIIRDQTIKISGSVLSYLVTIFDDLDEEEEKKVLAIIKEGTNELREANRRNSQEYLIKDLLFGGIAHQFTDPFYDLGARLYYSAKGDEEALEKLSNRGRPSDPADLIIDAMGGYGIFPQTGRRLYKSFSEWHLTDAEWRARKFGIEDEMGEALVVPFDKEGVERPLFSRYAYGISTIAHGTALFTGASWQTISSTVRRIQRLAEKAEQELHGKDTGKLKEIKSLKTVTVDGEKVELNEEQFERVKVIRKAAVKRMMLGEVNPVLTTLKEEYEIELPEIVRHELALESGERVAIETIRKIATDFAKESVILEYNLLEGLEEKKRAKEEKGLRRHLEAVEAYIKALNLGRTTPEEYEKRKVKK